MKPNFFTENNDLSKLLNNILSEFTCNLTNSHLNSIRDRGRSLENLLKHINADNEFKNIIKKASKQEPLHKVLTPSEHMFLVFTALTQSSMCRPKDKERGDIPDPDNFDRNQKEILNDFDKIGLQKELIAECTGVELIVLSGAFAFRFFNRLQYLIEHLDDFGDTIPHIHIASGDRKLDKERDIEFLQANITDTNLRAEVKKLANDPDSDESAMMKVIVQHFKLTYKTFSGTNVTYGKAIKKVDDHRARTDDTAEETASSHADKVDKKIIVVSDQPFGPYQLESFLPKLSKSVNTDKLVNVIGSAANINYAVFDFYDAFTRLCYATAVRELTRNHPSLNPHSIIQDYKNHYQCESLITQNIEDAFTAKRCL